MKTVSFFQRITLFLIKLSLVVCLSANLATSRTKSPAVENFGEIQQVVSREYNGKYILEASTCGLASDFIILSETSPVTGVSGYTDEPFEVIYLSGFPALGSKPLVGRWHDGSFVIEHEEIMIDGVKTMLNASLTGENNLISIDYQLTSVLASKSCISKFRKTP